MFNVIGSGALARTITKAFCGSSNTIWPSSTIVILMVILSPPVRQAADYGAWKWFLLWLTAYGHIGSIIASRAHSIGMAIAGFVIGGISVETQPLSYAVSSEVLPPNYC